MLSRIGTARFIENCSTDPLLRRLFEHIVKELWLDATGQGVSFGFVGNP